MRRGDRLSHVTQLNACAIKRMTPKRHFQEIPVSTPKQGEKLKKRESDKQDTQKIPETSTCKIQHFDSRQYWEATGKSRRNGRSLDDAWCHTQYNSSGGGGRSLKQIVLIVVDQLRNISMTFDTSLVPLKSEVAQRFHSCRDGRRSSE